MWRSICATMSMMLMAGCANIDEPTFDSSNPVSCMVIFGVAANGAKQESQPAVADQMVRRAAFLAKQQGGVEWIKKITPLSTETAKRMEAANNEHATLKMLDECIAKQDADPHFQAVTGRR